MRRSAELFGAVPNVLIPLLIIPVLFVPPLPHAVPAPPMLVLLTNCLILGLIGWPRLAESIRLMTRELAERPFVEGARAVGSPVWRLLLRHIFPHLRPRLAVMIAAEMGGR